MSMQMDQQSQHDTRYTKYGKKKRMGVGTAVNSLAYRKRLFFKQNPISTGTKINN